MATTVAILEAKLRADTGDFDRAMGRSDSRMKSLAKTAGKAGLAGALIGLGAVAKIGFDEFMNAQKVTAQTEAVLKSTGGVANVTAGQVDQLAQSLLKKSGVDDEVIRSGENMLLTFKGIRNEAGAGNDLFNQTTKAVLDMDTAMTHGNVTQENLAHSSILVGKALDDPIKGLTSLHRVGVDFDAQQKEMIKSMVAAGDTMGAQKIILAELNREFGGSAEALGKTLPGQINIAKEEFRNFSADIVAKVIPAIASVVSWVKDHWPEIQATVAQVRASVAPIITALADLFMSVVNVVQDHWPAISRNLKDVQTVVQDVAKVIAASLRLVVDLLHGDWAKAWDDLKVIVTGSIDAVKTVIQNQLDNLKALGAALGKAILNGFIDGITGIGAFLADVIGGLRATLVNQLDGIRNAAENIGSGIKNSIQDGVSGIGSWMKNTIDNIVDFWRSMPGRVADAIMGAGDRIKDAIMGIFDVLPGAVRRLLGIDSPSKVFAEIGENIVHGVIKGLEDAGPQLLKSAENLLSSLPGRAAGAAGAVAHAIGGALSGGGQAASASDARAIGQMLATQFGWGSGAEWKALDALWNQESGWNPLARNPSSGAFGIPQALPATKMPPIAQSGDATSQIMWGLNYIRERYGDPLKAWGGYWARGGWYHAGGIVPGRGDVPVVARGGEGIFTRDQMQAMGGAGTHVTQVYVGGERIVDVIWDGIRQRAQVFERRNARPAF